MKELFQYLRNRLKTLSSIVWVDKDKGQINRFNMRPAIGFPAALIKIDYPRTDAVSKKKQRCFCRITVRLVWDYNGDTDSTTENAELTESLSYFDTCNEVYDLLQAEIDHTIFQKPLERISQTEESRNDGLLVVNMVFETVVFDGF